MSDIRATLPDDIEVMPPGPELAAVVSTVDRERLAPGDLPRVTRARQRLIGWLEAQVLADLHRVARTVPDDGPLPDSATRHQGRYPWAEVEAAFALRWTHARTATTGSSTRLGPSSSSSAAGAWPGSRPTSSTTPPTRTGNPPTSNQPTSPVPT